MLGWFCGGRANSRSWARLSPRVTHTQRDTQTDTNEYKGYLLLKTARHTTNILIPPDFLSALPLSFPYPSLKYLCRWDGRPLITTKTNAHG